MPLDELQIARRLAFIRYLYGVGSYQARRPEPLCYSAILTLHDAVELFLHLAALHIDIVKETREFMAYWELPGLKDRLKYASQMRQLNASRVALKHKGVWPSKHDIQQSQLAVEAFLTEGSKDLFDADFHRLSLVSFVQCAAARTDLEAALSALAEGSMDMALEKTALAFTKIVDDYRDRKSDSCGGSVFDFSRSRLRYCGPSVVDDPSGFARFLQDQAKLVDKLHEAVDLLCLGIDYRKYAELRMLTPYVMRMADGHYETGSIRYPSGFTPVITRDTVQECIDFVVETALGLQQQDYDLEFRWRGSEASQGQSPT